jgi:hypothetical protein
MAELQGKSSVFDLPEVNILINATDTLKPFDMTSSDHHPISSHCSYAAFSKLFRGYEYFRKVCPDLIPHAGLIDVVMAYATVARNCIGGWNTSRTMHDVRLYTVASFANHSCDPNTEQFSEPIQRNQIVFRAKRLIKKGEEITRSYVDSKQTCFDRRATLLTVYGFDCNCSKCQREMR